MLENTIKESTTKVIDKIVAASLIPYSNRHNGLPGLILGGAGVGKSAAFYAAAAKLAEITGQPWQVVDLRVMLYDPTELTGIKTIDQTSDYAKALKPDWARNLDPKANILLCFEEVTKAPTATANACYQLILDRRAGFFEFGQNWIPFGTGNLTSSRSGDLPIPGALRNRFWIEIVENSAADWLRNFAIPQNLHPFVTSCVRANPDLLNTWSADENPLVFASERSWHSLSKVCQAGNPVTAKSFAVPLLGEHAGRVFQTHVDVFLSLPDPQDILVDPKTSEVPEDIGTAFYLAGSLAYWVTRKTMDALCTYARRCQHEVAVTMVKEAVTRHPELIETAAYIAFKCDYDPNQSR